MRDIPDPIYARVEYDEVDQITGSVTPKVARGNIVEVAPPTNPEESWEFILIDDDTKETHDFDLPSIKFGEATINLHHLFELLEDEIGGENGRG